MDDELRNATDCLRQALVLLEAVPVVEGSDHDELERLVESAIKYLVSAENKHGRP